MLTVTMWGLTVAALAAAPSALIDRVAAQVNDEVILLSEVSAAERDQGGAAASPGIRRLERRELLDLIIDATLLRQEAERLDLDPPEEVIAEAVEERLEALIATWPDPHTFDAWLEAEGTTLAELRLRLRRDEAEAWMRRAVIMTRVGTPPPDPDFAPQCNLAQIVLACPLDATDAVEQQIHRECLDLRRRVLEGEDFATLAARVSDDSATATRGGALGVIEFDDLDPGIAEALEGLEDGDLSLPIRTERGWHLLLVRRVITPRQRWFMEAFECERAVLVAELRDRAHIEVFLEE